MDWLMAQNVHPGRWQVSDRKSCLAHWVKIAFYNGIFGPFYQIMKQSATVLFFFSIPW